MILQDAMLESILRAVLKNPGRYPHKLAWAAQNLQDAREEKPKFSMRYSPPYVMWELNVQNAAKRFEKLLLRYSKQLPAILGEDNP